MIPKFTERDAESMYDLRSKSIRQSQDLGNSTYYTAYGEEPDNDINDLLQMCSIVPGFPIHCNRAESLLGDIQIEDSAHSNRAEETNEQSLLLLLDLWNLPMHGVDYGQTSDQEDENAQGDQSIDGDNIVACEFRPWADGTKPHEDGQIEKHVDGWLQRIVLRFQSKPIAVSCVSLRRAYLWWWVECYVLPGESIASDEAR